MKKIINLVVIFLSLYLVSCATIPGPEELKKAIEGYTLPVQGLSDKALVYIVRPGFYGSIIKFNVHLDDKFPSSEMGFTQGNEYIYFFTAPGAQKIYSLAENWAEIEINPKAGETIFIKQNPSLGILYARNELEVIEELEGKYHVKSLRPGRIIKAHKNVTSSISNK